MLSLIHSVIGRGCKNSWAILDFLIKLSDKSSSLENKAPVSFPKATRQAPVKVAKSKTV
jgi:hypothetical protein